MLIEIVNEMERGGKKEGERERERYTAARIRNCVSIEFTDDEVIKHRFLPPEMRLRSRLRSLRSNHEKSYCSFGNSACACCTFNDEKFRRDSNGFDTRFEFLSLT